MRAVAVLLMGLLALQPLCPQPASPPAEAGGRLLWRFVTGGGVTGKPALSPGGTIYVASEDRGLYALAADGSQRWRAGLGGKPSTAPVVASDGTLLVGTRGGRLLAIRANGRPLFDFDAGSVEPAAAGSPCLTPALGRDGSIYLPVQAGVLLCLDYRGTPRWSYRTRGQLAAGPSVDREGRVLLGTVDRRLLALDPQGRLLWELELPGPVGGVAVGAGGTLYVGAAGVHAVEPGGSLRWSHTFASTATDPVIGPGERILVASADGRVTAFDPDGRRLWQLSLRLPVHGTPALGAEGTAYLPTAAAGLVAVEAAGRSLWRFEAKQAVGRPTLAPGGTLVLGAEDWIVYALATDSAAPAGGSWGQLHHDGQNSGRAGAPADLDGPAAMALREMARSGSPALQQQALRDVAAHLDGRRYLCIRLGSLEEVLGALAGGGILSRQVKLAAEPPVSWPVRREACRLLGRLGSEGAGSLLLQLLAAAEEPTLKAEALSALGAIGLDPQGELGRAILYTVAPAARGAGGERVLLAAAAALREVVAGGSCHAADLHALAALAAGDYPEAVKRRASEYLSELSRAWEW